MTNPFYYWPSDPNGFLRHLIFGAILTIILVRTKTVISFIIILLAAFGKEFIDEFIRCRFWSFADIAFTISPFLFVKMYNILNDTDD